jgi:hypothetical protein
MFIHVAGGSMAHSWTREALGKVSYAKTIGNGDALFKVFTAQLFQVRHQKDVCSLKEDCTIDTRVRSEPEKAYLESVLNVVFPKRDD